MNTIEALPSASIATFGMLTLNSSPLLPICSAVPPPANVRVAIRPAAAGGIAQEGTP